MSKSLLSQSRLKTKQRHSRKIKADKTKMVQLFFGDVQHAPSVIEKHIDDEVKSYIPDFDGVVIIVDCTNRCISHQRDGAHV
jgi:hypothetical protein